MRLLNRLAGKRARPLFVCVAVALLGAVVPAGCGVGAEPAARANALVLHVVAPDCDGSAVPALLVAEDGVETGWGALQQVEGCGEPLDGHSWDGSVLQVWKSGPRWGHSGSFRMQLGRRLNDASVWVVGSDEHMRVDHRHLFLGTIDIGAEQARFVEPRAVDAVMDQLEDRQGCDGGRLLFLFSCGADWEHADLFTFEPAG